MTFSSHHTDGRDLNPLHFQKELNGSLARFIAAAAAVSQRRAPKLREEVIRRISSETLVKGPFVESLPDFDKGMSLKEMASEGVLHEDWATMASNAPELWERRLHAHQCQAMEQDENYIVATGTGSGKTEAFLYPLIQDLLSGKSRGKPGVKAILIYPLNALATDQMHRIARLLFLDLGNPGLTLGRYTGQVSTSDDRKQQESIIQRMPAFKENFGEDASAPKNWLLSRDEMLKTPPDILITNYAMLEHILLLPRNRALLKNADLRWMVLDELHSYTGATAIEVAFLLRKLKANLGIERGNMRCVGTSASLDPSRKHELVEFARDLFDEEFPLPREAIISAERKLHPAFDSKQDHKARSAEDWISLGAQLEKLRYEGLLDAEEAEFHVRNWNESTDLLHLNGSHFGDALIDALSDSAEVIRVAELLSMRIIHIEELAKSVFPDADPTSANKAIRALISLGVMAKPKAKGAYPLLPARYHLAVSAIPGMTVSLDKDTDEHWSALGISLQGREATDEHAAAWPLWVCRNCGEPYIECYDDDITMNPLVSPHRKNSGRRTFLRLAGKGVLALENEDDDDSEADSRETVTIDPRTGKILDNDASDGLQLEVASMNEAENVMKSCLCCGDTGGISHEPVTRIHPGDEMMGSYVSTLLLERMPVPVQRSSDAPIGGRHVLAFSDNRQDAAFFAPYIERISRVEAIRGAILSSLDDSEEPLNVYDLRDEVWSRLAKHSFVLYDGSLHSKLSNLRAKDRLLALIVAEATMGGLRQSMESYGLMNVSYEGFDRILKGIDSEISESSLAEFSKPILEFLLSTMRQGRAIGHMETKLELTDDSIWGEALADDRINWLLSSTSKRSRTRAVLPKTDSRHSRMTWVLEKRLGVDTPQSREFLELVWNNASRRSVGLFEELNGGKVLNVEKWNFSRHRGPLYVCQSCARISTFDVGGVCTAWRCEGKTRAVSSEDMRESEKSHYVDRYRQNPPAVIAREHTAALSTEDRNRIEDKFRDGHINLLSCTTTMEMGVDLGDLEAVVCRNVPPGIANYQQRAGRAGRRAQVAPIALTIARQNRYDQVNFAQFDDYLASLPAMPYLSLQNSAFLHRHQVSCVLSGWIEKRLDGKDRAGSPNLSHVLGSCLDEASLHKIFVELEKWLESEDGKSRLKVAVDTAGELNSWTSNKKLAEYAEGEIRRWIKDVSSRWQAMDKIVTEAKECLNATDNSPKIENDLLSRIQYYNRNMERYLEQKVVNLLSEKAVIPTYSFPIHSLHLEIITERDPKRRSTTGPELNRDAALAIAEYAPGSEVVAAGKIWRSAGISKRHFYSSERDSYRDQGVYRICKYCYHPEIVRDYDSFESECSHCKKPSPGRRKHFQKPIGFLTSHEDRHGRDPGTSRMRISHVDEARLITKARPTDYSSSDVEGIESFFAPAHIRAGDDDGLTGEMMVVNRGPKGHGYRTCSYCEYSEPADTHSQTGERKSHINPRTGRECASDELRRPEDLVHIYNTDIRGIHISHAIPEIKGKSSDDQEVMRVCLLRTVSEAFRLAAASLLEADPRDLRASTEISYDDAPLIILSDATPGGAGYVRRLISEPKFSSRSLLSKALEILDCPRKEECKTSCNRCLNDYSNQQYWEQFHRHTATDWLKGLLKKVLVKPKNIPTDSTPIARFSPRVLAIHLKEASKLVIVGSGIWGSGQSEETEEEAIASARVVRNWLEADSKREVTFIVPESLAISSEPNRTTTDKAVLHMLLSVNEGKQVTFVQVPDADIKKAPRVAISSAIGEELRAWEWFSPDGVDSVFSSATAGVSYHRVSSNPWAAEASSNMREISSPLAFELQGTHVYRFAAGQRRDFSSVFSSIKKGIYDVDVSDPYVAASVGNRKKLRRFIMELKNADISIKNLTIRWKVDVGFSNLDADAQVKELRGHLDSVCEYIDFQPWDRRSHFHDRRVVLSQDHESSTVIIDITSGVDNLMTVNRECSVFIEHQN